jgi:hypothetical protein
MTTIEELKTKISEAKNASDAPSVYIAGSINGGKVHFGESRFTIDRNGCLALGIGHVFCGSLKFRGHDLATAAYTGIHTITCKRCAPDEVNLDKRNKKYAHLFKHLGEKI